MSSGGVRVGDSLNVVFSGTGGHPQISLRNRIAALQKENREYKHKVAVLGELVDGMCQTISCAIVTIEGHEHNDKELMLLEADLTELVSIAEEKVSTLV